MTKWWGKSVPKSNKFGNLLSEFLETPSSKQSGALGGLLGPYLKPNLIDASKVKGRLDRRAMRTPGGWMGAGTREGSWGRERLCP